MTEKDGCLAGFGLLGGGCLATLFVIILNLAWIAFVIAGVATLLEWWFGFNVPGFRAPDWFGFSGRG